MPCSAIASISRGANILEILPCSIGQGERLFELGGR
jgi:hypothetical protein